MEGSSSRKKNKQTVIKDDFTELVFSWTLNDIFNEDLYRNQVEKIPQSFESVEQYIGYFVFPLVEETRVELAATMEGMQNAPFAGITSVNEAKPYGTFFYDVRVDYWRNRFGYCGKEPYKTLPGDIVILSNAKPETASDLQRVGLTWSFASVTNITKDETEECGISSHFKVKTFKDIGGNDGVQKSLFVVFLMNIITNRRIWKALHMFRNLEIISKVLSIHRKDEDNSNLCCTPYSAKEAERFCTKLNQSQIMAVVSSIDKLKCDHQSPVKLIWGPPGTGKTETVSTMLFMLLKMKCRTLSCAPTNVAITGLATRLVRLIQESFESESARNDMFCSFGDILLFGNKDRMKVDSDIKTIYLDERVERLVECFGPLTGWRHCLTSMADFLENCLSQYHIFMKNESIKAKKHCDENEAELGFKSFLDFMRTRFKDSAFPLRRCLHIFCTDLSRRNIGQQNFENIVNLFQKLDLYEKLLFKDDLVSEEIESLFSHEKMVKDSSDHFKNLCTTRCQCLSIIKTLRSSLDVLSLPSVLNMDSVTEYCFQNASLIFCTVASSYRLHSVEMEPLDLLVIDEAAQLKECETTIPFQLSGLKKVILIGDECQLPAMVNSKVSEEAAFGRSLFERLSSLGHHKHLLDVQYRMHPCISSFPNSKFYNRQIMDAPLVKSYGRHYLQAPMYGPYSFINIVGGREELEYIGHSRRNLVEVAIVMKIVQNLYKAWNGSKENLSVGVVSPYASQVAAIQDKLGMKFGKNDKFSVKVKSVDGFQGGEDDVIIISTVRSNAGGSIGFMESAQRTNVSLTRARHCLWILGNEKTLANSDSVWADLVCDAKDRHCFFNADEDNELAQVILDAKKDLDQLDDLLNSDSVLFKSTIWKILFSDNFRKSFGKLASSRTKKSVINLLMKLSSGWRPKRKNIDSVCESSSKMLKYFKVEQLYIVCTIDIVKESKYMQVLKVWDVLPLEEIPNLVKRLDSIFVRYTYDFIRCCKEKCLQGDLEVPKTWMISHEIVRFKGLFDNESRDETCAEAFNGRSYVEHSKVSESLLLMKFYSLSSGIVKHLLSDRDGRELDLPFEVTDEEQEIILLRQSTFILGRSGTGKTTVLTMKLFQKEQLSHLASEGYYAVKTSKIDVASQVNEGSEYMGKTKETVLRQLFVTVSQKLCYAVKQHVSNLKRNFSSEVGLNDMEYMDDEMLFKDVPDSFFNIPAKNYPLVITFQKFLMMLDGTLSRSFFERFHDLRKAFDSKEIGLRSIAFQTFIRTNEVTYDRFCSSYWPHFNTQKTKKFDPSRVFTEIISHIKGGWVEGKAFDSKLCQDDYVSMSEDRVSTLNRQQRERIYAIFQDYEKMKMERGHFDLADFVIDLHRRLKNEHLDCEKMDFVYIDEVQDMTMGQVALFKYICRNIDEGFTFSGDTAQTIARGIDFRFEDIRSLFYNEFLLESKNTGFVQRKEKGQISKIFNLRQNFRTHNGVLKLAQSVIDLLNHFFPNFVDVLEPETSCICGEAPVLLEPGSDKNVIMTIFGNCAKVAGNVGGFGAEQVILVRDDNARKEISDYIGKQALVLTIVECKGLEFQDVLLYNFFSASPLKNKWRVVYEFMKEQNMLDITCPKSFGSFSLARHNILCSELKQLYVAVTRTRQRLWICESTEEFSKPMYEYWNKLCLVEVRKLDDSLAQDMKVASSHEEWKAKGIKLFWQSNYKMATMCFERAGDVMWERRTKAAGLKADADRIRGSNYEDACMLLRVAAEIYESIGRADFAAECFCDLGEYERAGKLYLEKCGESELKKAGECFSLAGHCELAADVYARGNYHSECLSVCTKGKLFDMGLKYIEYWKQQDKRDCSLAIKEKDIIMLEQEFLESCALNYHELKDKTSMMKFVRSFNSMETSRNFLKSLDCLDELLVLEEESGHFFEAAEIARQRGDILHEADLLGLDGNSNEACLLILLYVLSNSLWAPGSKGWPLKDFINKEELLYKAKSFSEKESEYFNKLVSMEINAVSHAQTDLSELKQYLITSQQYGSQLGEVIFIRKILDALLHFSASKYDFEDDGPIDLGKYSMEKIEQNQASVETLMYFWNIWRDNILNIYEFLGNFDTQNFGEDKNYDEFCLKYFGVRRQLNDFSNIYVLVNPNADWVIRIDSFLRRSGKLSFIEPRHFASATRNHWSSELLSVGLKLLKTLEILFNFSTKNLLSLFCQSKSLIHIFYVTKFLLESKSISCSHKDARTLKSFLELCRGYEKVVFPLDWRKSLTENLTYLRFSDLSQKLIEDVILQNISIKGKLTYGEIGRVVMMWMGSGKPTDELCKNIIERFKQKLPWRAFIDKLSGNSKVETSQSFCAKSSQEDSLIYLFHCALKDTYNANWKQEDDYVTPNCFLYLVDRLLIMVSYFNGSAFTTKASFVEWLIFQQQNAQSSSCLVAEMNICERLQEEIFYFVEFMIEQFLLRKNDTIAWVNKSYLDVNSYYPLLVLKLIVIFCLVCLNSRKYFNILFDLLGRDCISSYLPGEFYDVLWRSRKRSYLNANVFADVFSEALKNIGDQLVFLSSKNNSSKFMCPHAIFIDIGSVQRREEIMTMLFPGNVKALHGETKNARTSSSSAKVEVERTINLLSNLIARCLERQPHDHKGGNIIGEAKMKLDELKMLSSSLDTRDVLEKIVTRDTLPLKDWLLGGPKIERLVNELVKLGEMNVVSDPNTQYDKKGECEDTEEGETPVGEKVEELQPTQSSSKNQARYHKEEGASTKK